MTRYSKVVDVFGDKVLIHWDGNVWVSPSNGQQHAEARRAMRVELRDLFGASGDDLDDPEIIDQIEGFLENMEDVDAD